MHTTRSYTKYTTPESSFDKTWTEVAECFSRMKIQYHISHCPFQQKKIYNSRAQCVVSTMTIWLINTWANLCQCCLESAACVHEYFQDPDQRMVGDESSEDPIYNGYREVLDSKSTDESLVSDELSSCSFRFAALSRFNFLLRTQAPKYENMFKITYTGINY